MRLPWPFGRSERTEVAPPAPVDFDGSVRTAPARRDWASLPPIQRTVADAPLVAPTTRFQADAVAGAHALPPILEPLGHEVDAAAPAGIVAATPVVVAALTSTRPLVDPPAQRRSHSQATGAAEWDAAEPMPSTSLPRDVRLDRQPAAGAQVAPIEPVRHLDIVPAGRPSAAPDRPLTRAPAPVAPIRPTVSRAAAAGSPPTTPPTLETPPLLPAGRPRMRTATEHQPTASREPTAPSRRPGLGAPLPIPPPTATTADAAPRPAPGPALQRLTPMPRPTPSGPGVQVAGRGEPPTPALDLPARPRVRPVARATELTTDGPARGSAAQPTSVDGAGPVDRVGMDVPHERPTLPELPVVRTSRGVADDASRPAAGATVPAPPAVQRAASGAARTTTTGGNRPSSTLHVRPIIGRRPFAPTSADPADERSSAGSAAVGGGDYASAAAALPASSGPVAQRMTEFAPVSFQTAAEAVTTGLSQAWLPSAPSPTMDDRAGHRGPLPASRTAVATRPPRVQRAASGSAAATSVTAAALPLVRSASAPTASTPAPSPDPAATRTIVFPGAARLGASATPVPQVQRAADFGGPAPASAPVGPTVTPAVQRVEGGSATPPDEGTGEQSEEELQRLAGALYGRLRAQLRSELIHEREARGLTFDNA